MGCPTLCWVWPGLPQGFLSVSPPPSACESPACPMQRLPPGSWSSLSRKLNPLFLSARLVMGSSGGSWFCWSSFSLRQDLCSWILEWVFLNILSPPCVVPNLEPGRSWHVSCVLLTCIGRSVVCVSSGSIYPQHLVGKTRASKQEVLNRHVLLTRGIINPCCCLEIQAAEGTLLVPTGGEGPEQRTRGWQWHTSQYGEVTPCLVHCA